MTPELHLPWLELTVLIPLIGACCVGLLKDSSRARQCAIGVCGLTMFCALGEWIDFTSLHTFEAHDHWDVFEFLFQKDAFVVDELSAPLIPLGAMLYLMTVMTTLRTKQNRFSFGWTLFSESVLLATLGCREPWMIISLMSIAVLPPWIEIRKRQQSTRVFSIHMLLFSALLVIGQVFISLGPRNGLMQMTGILFLTSGALLRSGVIPVHCWMTDLFAKATFGTSLLFITPIIGAYAVMRLVLPIAPAWTLQSIAIVSLITAVYAAGMALIQNEARRFFCYLFLSHSSLVLVGLEMVTPIGLTGALCVWISVGISLLGFGLTLRCVEARTGQLALNQFHGLYEQTPILAGLFLVTGLASIGFPGTVGFIGTELLIEGAVDVYPIVGFAVVFATTLNGIAVMHVWFRVFTGTRHPASISLHARMSERVTIIVLMGLILGGGLYPQPGVASRYHAAVALMQHRNPSLQSTPPVSSAAHHNRQIEPVHTTQKRHQH